MAVHNLPSRVQAGLAACLAFAGVFSVVTPHSLIAPLWNYVAGSVPAAQPAVVPAMASPAAACTIKGNISIATGERIYHVPGQDYYEDTRISPEHGERWFCTEQEALRAGWRKAKS